MLNLNCGGLYHRQELMLYLIVGWEINMKEMLIGLFLNCIWTGSLES